eukprot:5206000-Amphidinium_carterae.1
MQSVPGRNFSRHRRRDCFFRQDFESTTKPTCKVAKYKSTPQPNWQEASQKENQTGTEKEIDSAYKHSQPTESPL